MWARRPNPLTEAHTDVLVVGAGPAGASAAWCVARAGWHVVLVEARAQVGVPMQCAEFLPAAPGRLVADDAGVQTTQVLGTSLPSGQVTRLAAPGRMIDRPRFDQALAARAVDAGAVLRTATRCVAVAEGGRRVVVRQNGGVSNWRCKLLIAADGPTSSVARRLGLPPLRTLHSRQYRVRLRHPLHETRVWLSAAFPGGYGWLFPRGEEANLGVGVERSSGVDLRAVLDDFHHGLCAIGLVDEAVLSRTGGRIPVGGLRSPVVHGRVLFAGDAAGLAHPVTGAGIAPAVHAGELAGDAAVRFLAGEAQALRDYAGELEDCYGSALRHACARREAMLEAWREGRFDDAAARRGWVVFPEYFAA
ncbi:MAG TPA: NAD(P)/FAD-dependent oxidoreductase [Gammaproteobacteria bacterium]|nr:NAD(P)/FAD-dependent oxidoreductase [Gammaproteobacteria bacterium]